MVSQDHGLLIQQAGVKTPAFRRNDDRFPGSLSLEQRRPFRIARVVGEWLE
jgi:hypothetical protein